MSFRLRLAAFLVATLAIIQTLTAVLVYEVTRRSLIAEGERQLAAAADAFVRQLDDVSERVAASVEVLSLDYALRSAIAQRDQGTVVSALRNHGRRVGASRMLLVDLEGMIETDTLSPDGNTPPRPFPFADLMDEAFQHPAAAVVALDGSAYWMVVVPVLAPTPVALIAAGIPVDDRLLVRMERMSALPKAIELVTDGGDGRWQVLARNDGGLSLAGRLPGGTGALPPAPVLVDVAGTEYVALARRLDRSEGGAAVAAVLGYSLDEALAPYRPVATAWAVLLAAALLIGAGGAVLIARGVSRPVEALAATARRIEGGDYSPPAPIRQSGEIGQLSAAFTNMAEAIREREARIRHQADHDAVTGLANRVAAERLIARDLARRSSPQGVLLMAGLARLPEIVKTVGHAIGDRLMRDAGERVRHAAGGRPVARVTDTSFAIWMGGSDWEEALELAAAVLAVLAIPYQEADLAVDTEPAAGIALCPAHGSDASTLLQRAEVALFGAIGSNEAIGVYDPATDPHRPERLSLMSDLREALDTGQLQLHYQPKVHLPRGRVDGVEALVRWHHPRRGFVPPDSFIGLAEETGNIRRLSRWALATGVAQARTWAQRGWPLRVAVNLSARDLEDADLPARLDALLAEHAVAPDRLLLEITESAVMGEPDAAIQVLRQLAERGVDLAIDDFGVGQSSFAYLRRLPIREIKIDKAFVRRLADDAEDRTIVRSIVELGHHLGYHVTAEGVEDAAAFAFLADIGCDHAQGWHIAKAMPADAFEPFLAGCPWWPKAP